MSLFPEVDQAIEDIVNECVIAGVDSKPIKIDLEETLLPPQIKSRVYQEFDRVKDLLNFHTDSHSILEDGMSIVNYSTTLWLMRKILNWELKNFVELIPFKLKKLEK